MPIALIAFSVVAGITAEPAAAQSVTVAVSQSSDDAEEAQSDGYVNLVNTDLEIDLNDIDYLGAQYVGMRFQNVTVPVGATITNAQIQFHVDEVKANVAVTATFTGEDIDDAPTFSTAYYNVSGRTETSASVDWAIPHWAVESDEGAAQTSADLSPIIQEIVNRPGWVSGNDIVILIKSKSGSGYRTAEAWDGENANSPEITITYTADTTPPTAPVITQPTSPTGDTTPVVSGTASEDGGTITLTSDVDGVLSPTGTVTGGAWSITLSSALSAGSHSLTATHTDAATNESTASGAKILVIDTGQTVTVAVSQSSDDAEEAQSDGYVNLINTDLEIDLNDVDYLGAQYVGMRFQSIALPQGATISQAYIQFHVDEVKADVAVTATFTGEDIDDAPTFSTAYYNVSGRTETSASVDWAIPHWAAESDEGADQTSADLSPIIQEIVNRPGWVSGNDIVILIKSKSGSGYRTAEAWDGENANGPEITITYASPFRSKATGNWSSASTWERYDGASWIATTSFPTSLTAEAITLRSPYTVTVDAGVGPTLSLDEMTIDSGGTVVVDRETIVVDDTGTDLTIAGTLTINSGKVFNPSSSSSVSVSSGGTVTNNGTFTADGTSAVTFTSGSTYDHSVNGSNFPATARTTWSSGSTATVTGVTTTVPTELGETFHHFVWNSASQTASLDLNHAMTSIGGDLTVTSTGSGTLSWVQANSTSLSIGGNYVQSGGTFIYADGFTVGTMSAVDVSVTGGTLNLTTGTGVATLDIDDDLIVSGGGSITETGSGSGRIFLTGAAQQDVTADSGITNNVDITVNNTGGILLLSDLSAPADLTGLVGTIDANSQDLSVGGNLVILTDLTNMAAVTMDGASGDQNVTYSPGTWTVPTLRVNKASGSLLLGTNVSISTTASVLSGTLDVNSQTFTFPTGTTLYNAGTVTGSLVFERAYALVQDGWRMISSPLDGVNYSSLNTNFHTQGGTWADFSDGTATLQSADFGAQDWTEISGADAALAANDGYIFYMYDTLLGSTILPATWSVTGTVRASASRSLSWNTISADSYNYVGNRTTSNIDWDAAYAASTNVASTYSTWDPALTSGGGLSGYKYYNQATGTGLAGRYIAPFTAFMVEPTATGGTFVYSTSEAANLASANYFGKRESASPHIRLMVEGEGSAELETYLAFDPQATDGEDPFDGNRMRPLSQDYVTLVSMQDHRTLVYDGRSMEGGRQEYTLGVAATQPGLYELTWPDWHEIPEDWVIMLHDSQSGRQVDLREQESLTFSIQEEDTVPASNGGLADLDVTARFSLHISAAGHETQVVADVPDEVVLTQNYPNPFNAVTTIRYSVPEAAHVRLDVFDVLGRRVTRLVDSSESAGWKDVRWDAGQLPAGLYVYRLSVGNQAMTNTMTLLR